MEGREGWHGGEGGMARRYGEMDVRKQVWKVYIKRYPIHHIYKAIEERKFANLPGLHTWA